MSKLMNQFIDNELSYSELEERRMILMWEQFECEIKTFQLVKGEDVLEESEMSRAEAEGRNKTLVRKGHLGRWREKIEDDARPVIFDLPF